MFGIITGISQGMSWQHLHNPMWLERCNTFSSPLSGKPGGLTPGRLLTVA